ncbi:hypothetical protein BIW11_09614 [Tropilaelaps mercedesae]|uniref:Uncharacterized protein n=1 Tax=Tropilaelaps mercedesae TaxID=418985 RepID=A0A1V9XJB5_9ACAR|nr:hypothetical protein BIW11_09614 [Tropilaelaps mercedesae]
MRILGLVFQVYSRSRHFFHYRPAVPWIHLPVKCASTSVAAVKPRRPQKFAPPSRAANARNKSVTEELDLVLSRMEQKKLNSNRVFLKSVNTAVRLAQRKGKLTPRQAAQLLGLTGECVRDGSQTARLALTELVFRLVDRKELDISHYNLLLQVIFPASPTISFN